MFIPAPETHLYRHPQRRKEAKGPDTAPKTAGTRGFPVTARNGIASTAAAAPKFNGYIEDRLDSVMMCADVRRTHFVNQNTGHTVAYRYNTTANAALSVCMQCALNPPPAGPASRTRREELAPLFQTITSLHPRILLSWTSLAPWPSTTNIA